MSAKDALKLSAFDFVPTVRSVDNSNVSFSDLTNSPCSAALQEEEFPEFAL